MINLTQLTEEQARYLDTILLRADNEECFDDIISSPSGEEVCDDLEKLGYISFACYQPTFYNITPAGSRLIAYGGFYQKYLDNQEKILQLSISEERYKQQEERERHNLEASKKSARWAQLAVWISLLGILVSIAIAYFDKK